MGIRVFIVLLLQAAILPYACLAGPFDNNDIYSIGSRHTPFIGGQNKPADPAGRLWETRSEKDLGLPPGQAGRFLSRGEWDNYLMSMSTLSAKDRGLDINVGKGRAGDNMKKGTQDPRGPAYNDAKGR